VLGLLIAGASMPPESLNPDIAEEPDNDRPGFIRRIIGGIFG